MSLFGSRVDGDIDLLVTVNEVVDHPAELLAKISAHLSRVFQGQKGNFSLSTGKY